MKRNVQRAVKEEFSNLESGVSQLTEKVMPYLEQAVDKSKEFYNDAVEAIPEDKRRVVALTAAGLAVGVIAYKLGKLRRSESLPKAVSEATGDLSNQLAPVFKFIKLWMLYRVSV